MPEIDQLILAPRGRILNFPSIDRFIGNQASATASFDEVSCSLTARKPPFRPFGPGARSAAMPGEFYLASNANSGVGLAVDRGKRPRSAGSRSGRRSRMQLGGNFISGLEFAQIEDLTGGRRPVPVPDGFDMKMTVPPAVTKRSFGSQSAALAGESHELPGGGGCRDRLGMAGGLR